MKKGADKIERIDSGVIDAFEQYVQTQRPDLLPALEEYKDMQICSYDNSKQKLLTYGDLGVFLELFDITMKEFYEALGVSVDWNSEDEKDFFEVIERVPDKIRSYVLSELTKAAQKLKSPFWDYPAVLASTPTERFRASQNRFVPKSGDSSKKDELFERIPLSAAVIKDNHGFKRLDFLSMPEAARVVGVPLKWLLALEDSAPCMTKDLRVDNLMVLYSELGDNEKLVLRDILGRELK